MSRTVPSIPARLSAPLVALFAAGMVTIPGCAPGPSSSPDFQQGQSRSLFSPKGSPWTILCLELQGPHHVERLEQIADTLRRTDGIRPDEVSTTDDADGVARLYYGVYYRKSDRKTGVRSTPQRLTNDLKFIKELGTGPGQYFFMGARVVRVPTPHVGNPNWDLSRVEGMYSLQVGVFEPTDEFWQYKQAAAEFCKLLREKGYEAYYYHTESSSLVTVGVFGPQAVISQSRGLPTYSAEVIKLQQSDELLMYNRLNGAVYRARTEKGNKVRMPSRLVHIPHKEASAPW